jgi:transposase InsO family protein
MITKSALKRYHILCFWNKHGLTATTDAYKVKRSTLYHWQKLYHEGGKAGLALGSTEPKKKRLKKWDWRIIEEIKQLRTKVCPNMGKDKVKPFLDEYCQRQGLKSISVSTIGRIIKQKQIYYRHKRVYCTGRIKEYKRIKKKRLPAGFKATRPGELIQIDTIVRFDSGIKRYIITAVDTYSRYNFALCYKQPDSASARDFFQKLEMVSPYEIKQIQTDNGSEFHKYFAEYLEQSTTTHYFNYPRQPYKQGHVERYNRTLQEEFINQNVYKLKDHHRFNQELVDYLIWHNTKRPHWSLRLKSPVDYLIENNLLSKMLWTDTIA